MCRAVLSGVVLLAAAVLIGPNAARADALQRPNVVLVVIDTTRADHMGLYGYARDNTPNLDAFARQAVVFENAYAPSTWTMPSFASLLLSRHAYNHNKNTYADAGGQVNGTLLYDYLRRDGYYTYSVQTNQVVLNLAKGLDQQYFVDAFADDFCDEEAVDHACDFFAGEQAQSPFFAFIGLMSPHWPYNPLNPHWPAYLQDAVQLALPELDADLPREQGDLYTQSELPQEVLDIVGPPTLPDGTYDDYRLYLAAYDAEIKYVDEQVQRLFDALQDNGLLERSLVIVTSDHGENMVDHDPCMRHGGKPYESVVHVPLVIRFPGQDQSLRVSEPVRLIDIFPTVFQWLDMDVDEALDGESLLDLVSSVAVAPAARSLLAVQRPAITYFRDGDTDTSIYGLRDGDYKLLRSDTGGVTAAWELYDLAVDPDEQYDICEVETDMAELLSADIDNVLSGRDLGTGQDKTTPVGAGGCRAGNGQGGWTWGALLAGAALVRLFRRRRT